jgi:hypothetical protein
MWKMSLAFLCRGHFFLSEAEGGAIGGGFLEHGAGLRIISLFLQHKQSDTEDENEE